MRRVHLSITDSTNRHAGALMREAPHAPVLVVARQQTAGRGRGGRAWQSPVGGAWFTLGWPTDVSPTDATVAPLLAGLAVRDQVAALCNEQMPVRIKWPNDVLLDGRKVAGILCEQHLDPASARRALLVGVGVNANLTVDSLGEGLRHPATSLREALGTTVNLDALIDGCAVRLTNHLRELEEGGFGPEQVERINAALAWRGQPVVLQRGEIRIEGVFKGIDHTGRAIVGGRAYEAGEVRGLARASDHTA